MKLAAKVRAYARLGWRSLADVGLYRAGLKTGLHPVLKIVPVPIAPGDFFCTANRPGPLPAATQAWQDRPWAFGRPCGPPSDDPPDWHANILTGARVRNSGANWYEITAFSKDIGDIKTVWEASRFDWVLSFAQRAARGEEGALDKLNRWLTDWTTRNPAYTGPNWMCGQETSIRTAHLVLAAMLLGDIAHLSAPVETLLRTHLRRIAPTTAYARGQDNNHATSEAMALFAGGLWLAHGSSDDTSRAEGRRYAAAGRKLAEERVRKLIFDDGGFAQYSHVYHRLMIDSLSVMEMARRTFSAPEFSAKFLSKAAAASQWLRFFTEPEKGDVPNMGSNDGAWLLPVGTGEMRDFRPSCALASTLFDDNTAYDDIPSAKDILKWFDIAPKKSRADEPRPSVRLFADSGIVALSEGDIRVYMRLPGTRFRPHQADALHVDIWRGSQNLVGDAGTYSYAEAGWDYFPSTAAHNTIEFDARDQMPRIGRFLFGEWLQRGIVSIDASAIMASASYTDHQGAKHQRTVQIKGDQIFVEDRISGVFDIATIRWRPASDAVRISTDGGKASYIEEKGLASLYYQLEEPVKVNAAKLSGEGTFSTVIEI